MSITNEFAWPQKGKQLFIDSGSDYEFSHFGWGDPQTQFVGYMDGYKAAADKLIADAITSRAIDILDTFIFPICFLYRQYLELVMKYIYLHFSEVDNNEKANTLKETSHDLAKMWIKIKPLLLEDASPSEMEDVEIVETYIQQFHNIDKSSFTFRYPIGKNLEKVLPSQRRINLPILKEGMDELSGFFEGCIGKLDAMSEIKAEVFQEYLSLIDI